MLGLFGRKKAPAPLAGPALADRHFALIQEIDRSYTAARPGGVSSPAMDQVVDLCREDLALAAGFADYWRREFAPDPVLPRFPAFERLALIYEKRGDLVAALSVLDRGIELGFTRGARPELDLIERRRRLAAKV